MEEEAKHSEIEKRSGPQLSTQCQVELTSLVDGKVVEWRLVVGGGREGTAGQVDVVGWAENEDTFTGEEENKTSSRGCFIRKHHAPFTHVTVFIIPCEHAPLTHVAVFIIPCEHAPLTHVAVFIIPCEHNYTEARGGIPGHPNSTVVPTVLF